MEEKILNSNRLEQVRDVFVFCCYTGLSYVDVEKLTPKEIAKGLDGEYWINVDDKGKNTSSEKSEEKKREVKIDGGEETKSAMKTKSRKKLGV